MNNEVDGTHDNTEDDDDNNDDDDIYSCIHS